MTTPVRPLARLLCLSAAPLAVATFALALLLAPIAPATGQEAEAEAEAAVEAEAEGEAEVDLDEFFQWQHGPLKAKIGALAEIDVPEGYQFTASEGTQRILELLENPIDGDELGLLMPTSEDEDWFIVFEFSDSGYVSDEDRDDLDADAILEAIREGNKQGNELRRQRGWATLEIEGWASPPHYDAESNNLEWAIRASSEGEPVVNYNTRLLGRSGVMEANLVVDPDKMDATLPTFKKLLAGYSYLPGHKYGDFREGDKVAQYGLAALVTGGVAAVALKSGLLQKLWKLIVIGVIAIGAFFKNIVNKFTGGGRGETRFDA